MTADVCGTTAGGARAPSPSRTQKKTPVMIASCERKPNGAHTSLSCPLCAVRLLRQPKRTAHAAAGCAAAEAWACVPRPARGAPGDIRADGQTRGDPRGPPPPLRGNALREID